MTRSIKKRSAAKPAISPAQTEETATAAAPDVAVEVEMQRRFNEFRSQYLDERAKSINWWLGSIAIVLAFFGVVVAIAGFIGFQSFREIETEARKHVEEIKIHKAQAEKDTKAITQARAALQRVTSEFVANASPPEVEQVEKAVEQIRQTTDASLIDTGIAEAYLLQKAGKAKEAIEKWRAIANLAEGIDNEAAVRAWVSVGYLLSENPIEAISAYDQAIRIDPKDAAAYNNRGIAKDDLEQYQDAIKDYNEAIRLDLKYAAAYYNRGIAKANLKQYQDAIKDYNEAIRLDPKYAAAYYNRGNAKDDLEQYQAAIEDFNEAIRLEPKFAAAYNNRGISLFKLERMDEARSDFQIALRLAQETGDEELATKISNLIQIIDNPGTQ